MMIPLKDLQSAYLLPEDDIELFIENKIGWEGLIEAMKETFVEEAVGKTDTPPKTIIDIGLWRNDYRVMPAYMEKYPQYVGTKIISCCSACPEKFGIPLATGTYMLNDAETMRLLAIFPCNKTTAYRTAAATAVAVNVLSHKESKVLGIIGCGQQAYYHIPAITAVRNIETILLFDTNREQALRLSNSFKGDTRPTSRRAVLSQSDILVTLTPTYRPHLFVKDLRQNPNVSFFAVGGDSDIKNEWHHSVLTQVDHYCDNIDQAMHTGLVSGALKSGKMEEMDLKSLGDLMVGNEDLDKIYEGMVLRRIKNKGGK
jgi:alanine dehydrogenase